jgi:hypothetical protein
MQSLRTNRGTEPLPGLSKRADAGAVGKRTAPAFRQSFPNGLGRVREVSIVKGKLAVVAKLLFELLAKVRDGSADAARPAVLNAEVLPYGGFAEVWIFGVQFGLRPRGEAHSWGPWRSQPCAMNAAGTAMTASRTSRSSSTGSRSSFPQLLPTRDRNFFPAVQL